MNLQDTQLIIALIIGTMIILTAVGAVVIALFLKILDKLQEQRADFYVLLDRLNGTRTKLYSMSKDQVNLEDDLKSLSSSFTEFAAYINAAKNEKIYPTPSLAQMIETTIAEQIDMQIELQKNLPCPKLDSLTKITANVIKTYPNVDEDYIETKCVVALERLNRRIQK